MTGHMAVSGNALSGAKNASPGGSSTVSDSKWIFTLRSMSTLLGAIFSLAVPGSAAGQTTRGISDIAGLKCVEVRFEHVDSAAFIFGLDTGALGVIIRDRLHQAGISTLAPTKSANIKLPRSMHPIVALAIHVQWLARGEEVPLVAAGVSAMVRRETPLTGARDSVLWTGGPPLRVYPTLQVATRSLSMQALAVTDLFIAAARPSLAGSQTQTPRCP